MYLCVCVCGLQADFISQFNYKDMEQIKRAKDRACTAYLHVFGCLSKCIHVHIDNEIPVCLVSPVHFP